MSFSNEVKNEMLAMQIKKNCCRKAFMLGALYNARIFSATEGEAILGLEETAKNVATILGDVASPLVEKNAKAGRVYYTITFSSKAVSSFLYKISNAQSVEQAAAFRCEGCKSSFLRGVLVSSSSVNDPLKKGYHLEISLLSENEDRIPSLKNFLCDCGFSPKETKRQNKSSLYFKSNTQISDILSYAGAMRASFDFANISIERDIRNNENRATNCVAKNISKSVDATRKQIEAIKKLKENHKFDALSEELMQTASLRLENEDVSLSELALLHNPPISKSGLNHRLEKICALAAECD